MLSGIRSLFRANNPRNNALSKMARIVSHYSMARMIFERGLENDSRNVQTLYTSVGVWLFPGAAKDISIKAGIPAVTRDLRSGGLGIMSLLPVMTETAVIAVPDEERWTFLECEVRHRNVAPGGWHQIGIQVKNDVHLDVETIFEFERRCKSVMGACEPQTA